uniref:Uncharacterized protein n=1 Tax=viral metagenome TaxID=1070528 RepID=A0A6H1ZGY5_9ZZZZ
MMLVPQIKVADELYKSNTVHTHPISKDYPLITVAAYDAPARLRARANYTCNGTNDIELQQAIDEVEANGGGGIQCVGNTFNFASGLVFSPLNLSSTLYFNAPGVTFNYSGSGVAITANTNVVNGNQTYTWAKIVMDGFRLTGTSSGTTGLLVRASNLHIFRNIKIDGFTGAGAWAIELKSVGSGEWLEQNYFEQIYATGNSNGIYWNSDYALFMNNRILGMAISATAGNTAWKNTTCCPYGCVFIGVSASPQGDNVTCIDFGNDTYARAWYGTVFINIVIDSGLPYTGVTCFTNAGPHNPLLIGAEVSTGALGSGAVLWGGTARDTYLNRAITHHTAYHVLTVKESGSVHTNLGAGGAITLALPQDAVSGCTFKFGVMTAQELRINPGAAGAIYINGAKQTDSKYITADDEAESIQLIADGNGDWLALSAVGTWTVET